MKKISCLYCNEITPHDYLGIELETGKLKYECYECENLTFTHDLDKVDSIDIEAIFNIKDTQQS